MAAQWPLVLDKLLELLPTLPNWGQVKVIDGPPVDDNTASLYCTVGHVDVTGHPIDSGTFTQQRDQSGGRLIETGEVKAQLVSQDERNNLAKARQKVFPLVDDLEAAWRADYRLGVLSPDSASTFGSQIVELQTASGPFVTVIFTFSYTTITQN